MYISKQNRYKNLGKMIPDQIESHFKNAINYNQVNFIPMVQEQFNIHRLINVFHHINLWGNSMFISTDKDPL